MARVAMMMACLYGACEAAEFSESFLGTWSPVNRTVQAILGPVAVPSLTVAKHKTNGDYWMSYIPGQVFRVREDKMEYCFAHVVQSPFVVDTAEDNLIRFCYKTGDRMHTHKTLDDGSLATGCDAAKIELELHDDGTLEFSFYMSPPIRHAWAVYKRIGPPPPIASYSMMGGNCDPLHPGRPTLGDELDSSASRSAVSSMCPALHHKKQKELEPPMPEDEEEENFPVPDEDWAKGDEYVPTEVEAGLGLTCRNLDGGALGFGAKAADKAHVKLQYQTPTGRCWPCKVSYTVSAKISEDEYLAFGFKGMAYRAVRLPQRPCYFGMCLDDVDKERTGNANIVLGYAGGSAGECARQMEAPYAGAPTDVEGNPDVFDFSVERSNGRTIMRFKLEQHVGKNFIQIKNFFNAEEFSARTMWAVGAVEGSGCDATPQFHRARGTSPFGWFAQNPKTSCMFDAEEFGHSLDRGETFV